MFSQVLPAHPFVGIGLGLGHVYLPTATCRHPISQETQHIFYLIPTHTDSYQDFTTHSRGRKRPSNCSAYCIKHLGETVGQRAVCQVPGTRMQLYTTNSIVIIVFLLNQHPKHKL